MCFLLASCTPQSQPSSPPQVLETPRATPTSKRSADASGFRLAREPYRFTFPRDHGAHREFQTEWWYYTGHLSTREGRRFGFQVTFFRNGLVPPRLLPARTSKWATRDLMFAHFALSDPSAKRFLFDDRIARASALPAAGADPATNKPPRIWLGDWNLQFQRDGSQILRARGRNQNGDDAFPFALELSQVLEKPPIAHGRNGVSRKGDGEGNASHYYSMTRLQSRGKLTIGNTTFEVSGQSWFDHEFGSSQLSPDLAGWDWFSLQMSDGRELMLYLLRQGSGGTDAASSGTLVARDGTSKYLPRGAFSVEALETWTSPRSGAKYPVRWKVRVPDEDLELEITPALADQELDTRRSTGISYWEGLVGARGTSRGASIEGAGYVELTGYAKPFSQTF